MFGILEAINTPRDGVYTSYDELIKDLNNRVSKDGYKIVKARSHKGRLGPADDSSTGIVRCDLVCDRGGRPYKSTATKHKSSTKKTNCPWKAKAVYRKSFGGWVLTIHCDQHNHEPGTPEPPTPEGSVAGEEEDAEADDQGPQPDTDTSEALQVAGVSNAALRLTGDTFQQFKTEYRKMSPPDRLGILSQLQLRVAAIYAIQNEEVQRQRRQEAQHKRHQEIEASKRQRQMQKQRARRPQPQGVPQQQTPVQQPLPQQQLLQQQTHQFIPQQMSQGQFQMEPESPSQQLMAINLAQIQQYTGPAAGAVDKRTRGVEQNQ